MASDADDDHDYSPSSADEDSSGTDDFDEDLAAISRACTLTGTDPNDLHSAAKTPREVPSSSGEDEEDTDSEEEEDDDELLRGTYRRYAEAALNLIPLSTLPPAGSDEDDDGFESDEDDDDLAILQGVEHRCEAYFTGFVESSGKNKLKPTKQIVDSSVALERKNSFDLLSDKNYVSEGSLNSLDVCRQSQTPELLTEPMKSPAGLIDCPYQDNHDVSLSTPGYSSFPKSARLLVNSLNKNRACQQFLRSKIIQIQARIEENEKLKQRVQILKDFQVACKKRTGRALTQKKDARLQLILAKIPNPNSKTTGKKKSALYNGPKENPHVANYKSVLTKFPISLNREKWTDTEKENLSRGIKQQIQEQLVQKSVHLIRNRDGASSQDLDSIYASIGNLDISPEDIRLFLPKVNWEQLVSLYVPGRSGEECEARWLNFEDPLINHSPWTNMEEKKLLCIVQERGIENWVEIAVSLGKNRTPSQCLAHYQRSLNPSMLKSEWTEGEDKQLRAAVEACGESNWKVVASFLEGRTGTQCSNRWIKTLHPARKIQGKWTADEDKRLRVAVMLFGPKSWREIAKFVPGRTHVQCRERWSNCLDPDVNMGGWSEEEDARLTVAFQEHFQVFINSGKDISWAKVGARMPGRTDSQCRRRSLLLFPKLRSVLRDAKKMRARVGLRNFVDRESDRPAFAINDFIPQATINSALEPRPKKKRRSRSKKSVKGVRNRPQEERLLTNGDVDCDSIPNVKVTRPCKMKKEGSKTSKDMTKNHERTRQRKNVGVRKSSFGRQIRKPRNVDASSSDDASLKGRDGKQEGLSLQLRGGDEVQNLRGNHKSKRRIRKHSLGSKTFVNSELSDSATVSDDDEPIAKIACRRRTTFKAHSRKTSTVSRRGSCRTRHADDDDDVRSYVDNVLSDSATLSDDDVPLAKFIPRKRRKTLKAHARKTLNPPCSEIKEAGVEVSVLSGNNTCVDRKRMFGEVYTRRRKGSGLCEESQSCRITGFEVAKSESKKSGASKRVKSSNSAENCNFRVSDSCKRRPRKRSRARDDDTPPRKNVLDVEEDGDVTLATLIKGKARKKIKLAEKGNDDLPHGKNWCDIGLESISPCCHERSEEGETSRTVSLCEEEDCTSDVDLHPPGFEYPIYRKQVT